MSHVCSLRRGQRGEDGHGHHEQQSTRRAPGPLHAGPGTEGLPEGTAEPPGHRARGRGTHLHAEGAPCMTAHPGREETGRRGRCEEGPRRGAEETRDPAPSPGRHVTRPPISPSSHHPARTTNGKTTPPGNLPSPAAAASCPPMSHQPQGHQPDHEHLCSLAAG